MYRAINRSFFHLNEKRTNKLTITFSKNISIEYKLQILDNLKSSKFLKWKRLDTNSDENIYHLSDYHDKDKTLEIKTKELLHEALLYNVINNKDYVNYSSTPHDLNRLDVSRRDKYCVEFTVSESLEKISSFVIE